MENNELDNVNTEIDTPDNDVDGGLIALIIAAVAGGCASIYFGVKSIFLKKKLKEAQEKNVAFQEVIRKHQAEIDALTSEKERQNYLIQLYEKYISEMEK